MRCHRALWEPRPPAHQPPGKPHWGIWGQNDLRSYQGKRPFMHCRNLSKTSSWWNDRQQNRQRSNRKLLTTTTPVQGSSLWSGSDADLHNSWSPARRQERCCQRGREHLSWSRACPGGGAMDSLLWHREGKVSARGLRVRDLKAQQVRSQCELIHTLRSSRAPNFYYYCPLPLVKIIPLTLK